MNNTITNLLSDYPVVIEQAVIWGDMDAYQHVNNVVYFRYLENVRVEYLQRIGWKEIEKGSGIGPIVSALKIRFRKPLYYPDTISIGAKLGTMGEDRFTLDHIIVSHNLEAIATVGESTVVTFNYGKELKAPIPDLMRQRILALEGNSPRSIQSRERE